MGYGQQPISNIESHTGWTLVLMLLVNPIPLKNWDLVSLLSCKLGCRQVEEQWH